MGAWGAGGGCPTTKVAYYVAALITKVAYTEAVIGLLKRVKCSTRGRGAELSCDSPAHLQRYVD